MRHFIAALWCIALLAATTMSLQGIDTIFAAGAQPSAPGDGYCTTGLYFIKENLRKFQVLEFFATRGLLEHLEIIGYVPWIFKASYHDPCIQQKSPTHVTSGIGDVEVALRYQFLRHEGKEHQLHAAMIFGTLFPTGIAGGIPVLGRGTYDVFPYLLLEYTTEKTLTVLDIGGYLPVFQKGVAACPFYEGCFAFGVKPPKYQRPHQALIMLMEVNAAHMRCAIRGVDTAANRENRFMAGPTCIYSYEMGENSFIHRAFFRGGFQASIYHSTKEALEHFLLRLRIEVGIGF